MWEALKLSGFVIVPEHHVGSRLKLDFLVPSLNNLAIEVQGSQHHELSTLFHDSKAALDAQIRRDERKAEMCAEQGMTLIYLSESEVMGAKDAPTLWALILTKINLARATEDEW